MYTIRYALVWQGMQRVASSAGVQVVLDAASMTADDLADLKSNGFNVSVLACRPTFRKVSCLSIQIAYIFQSVFILTQTHISIITSNNNVHYPYTYHCVHYLCTWIDHIYKVCLSYISAVGSAQDPKVEFKPQLLFKPGHV